MCFTRNFLDNFSSFLTATFEVQIILSSLRNVSSTCNFFVCILQVKWDIWNACDKCALCESVTSVYCVTNVYCVTDVLRNDMLTILFNCHFSHVPLRCWPCLKTPFSSPSPSSWSSSSTAPTTPSVLAPTRPVPTARRPRPAPIPSTHITRSTSASRTNWLASSESTKSSVAISARPPLLT